MAEIDNSTQGIEDRRTMNTKSQEDISENASRMHVEGSVVLRGEADAIVAEVEVEDLLDSLDDDPDPEANDPVIENPSKDIAAELGRVFSDGMDFAGNFYFNKTYTDAPNPIISIGSLGHIGLPLSAREAKAIISESSQAPFGKGERTVIDREVRDTWEVDASKISFGNPAWNVFVQRAVEEVCTGLGVDLAVSQPRSELYKLLLYETGSHFLAHQDTEKVDAMFATMVIVLPSPFTGGAAHVSHGATSNVIDVSTSSLTFTSLLSWWTDVVHEIKPITGGYRLALSYNLFHTTNTLRPSLPTPDGTLDRLRHILLSWKQTIQCRPLMIVYLLEHKYSRANLHGSALKGRDAHRVATLRSITTRLGFNIGLVHIECHATGHAINDYGQDQGHWDDEDSEDGGMRNDDLEVEMEESDTAFERLVDLEGRLLAEDLLPELFEVDAQTIPDDLQETLEGGSPDDEDYEGYQGNYGGSVDRWYRRTGLVIWPKAFDSVITKGEDFDTWAIKRLLSSDSTRASRLERRLAGYLYEAAMKGAVSVHDAAKCICAAATRWNDILLWERAVEIGGTHGTSLFDIEEAMTVFGFERVERAIDNGLQHDSKFTSRWGLLETMEKHPEAAVDPHVLIWIAERRERVLRSIKKLSKDEVPLVLSVLTERGIDFLQDVIIPQMQTGQDQEALMEFALTLYLSKDRFSVPNGSAILVTLVRDLLASAIANADYYAEVEKRTVDAPGPPGYPDYGRLRPTIKSFATPTLVLLHLKAGFQTNNSSLIADIIEKLIRSLSTVPGVASLQAETVLFPILKPLHDMLKENQAHLTFKLDALCNVAVKCYLADLKERSPSKTESDAIILAVALGGGIELMKDVVIPRLQMMPYQESLYKSFISSIRGASEQAEAFAPITKELLETIVKKTPLTSHLSIIPVLEFCFEVGESASCVALINRILDPAFVGINNIKGILMPLLPELAKFLQRQNLPLSTDPYRHVFKVVMMQWAWKILGPKPADPATALASVRLLRCTCDQCRQVLAFLTSRKAEKTLALYRIGAQKRKHVESELTRVGAQNVASWRNTGGSPQGLAVDKRDIILKPAVWINTRQVGTAALNSFGVDQVTLRHVFGEEDYANFLGFMEGKTTTLNLPQVPIPERRNVPPAMNSTGSSRTDQAGSLNTQQPVQNAAETSSNINHLGLPTKKRKRLISEVEIIDLTTP